MPAEFVAARLVNSEKRSELGPDIQYKKVLIDDGPLASIFAESIPVITICKTDDWHHVERHSTLFLPSMSGGTTVEEVNLRESLQGYLSFFY